MAGKYPKLKPLAFAVFTTFAALPLTSWADQVSVTYTLGAQYILDAKSGTAIDGTALPGALVPSGNGADYLAAAIGDKSKVFLHAYGSENGYWGQGFGTKLSGGGIFYAQTSVNYHAVFTNTSSVAQSLLFDFNLNSGGLGFQGVGSGIADLLLQIKVNGVSYSWDHTTMSLLNGVTTCSGDDFGVLADYMACGGSGAVSTSANGKAYSLNLGLVDSMDSLTIDYDIVATLSGDMSGFGALTRDKWVCDQFGFDSNQNVVCKSGHWQAVEEYGFYGGSVAQSGAVANGRWEPTANSVPEPASLALLGIGFAGLFASRRRRMVNAC